MIPIIEDNREAIAELCRRFRVRRLDVFGSAAESKDNREVHDVDFVVRFEPCSDMPPADQYFGLLEALRALLDRPVDLVEDDGLKNPVFIRELNRSRVGLYAA